MRNKIAQIVIVFSLVAININIGSIIYEHEFSETVEASERHIQASKINTKIETYKHELEKEGYIFNTNNSAIRYDNCRIVNIGFEKIGNKLQAISKYKNCMNNSKEKIIIPGTITSQETYKEQYFGLYRKYSTNH